MVKLKHEAHVTVAPAGELTVVEHAQILPCYMDLPGRGAIDAGEQIQQRALAGP